MNAGNNSADPRPKKGSRKVKVIKRLLIITVVVVLLLFFMIPVYLSSAGGREFVISRINSSIDGRVDMGDLSVGWFKGVRLTDFRFEDSAKTTFVTVKEISTKPYYFSLLFGRMAFGKTLIDNPDVVINLKQPPAAPPAAVGLSPGKPVLAGIGPGLERIDLEVKQGREKTAL